MFVTLGKMALLYYYYVKSIAPVANHLYALNSHAGLCFLSIKILKFGRVVFHKRIHRCLRTRLDLKISMHTSMNVV
jgi:hypothetical protein